MNTKALRQKVLDLAIHGKLVPQNQNDESATVLLEKIRAEKADKIKKGELKADKKDSFIFVGSDKRHYEQFADGTVKDIEDEIPFEVPEGWAWCRLGQACSVLMGQSPEGTSVSNNTKGMEFHQGKIFFTDKYLAESGTYTSEITRIAPENSLLLCVRAPVGVVNITKRKICIGRGLCAIKPNYKIDENFWFYWIQCLKSDFEQKATGTTFKAISVDIIKQQLIPLPPLLEQQLIINTIESFFSIVKNLEKDKFDLQTAIKQTKSKILDLAIHGKLVPQDPNDEPAEELLKRIATSDNRPYKKFDDDIPFSLPQNWEWCYLGDICKVSSAKRVLQQDWKDSGIPFYRAREIAQLSNSETVKEDLFITPELYDELKNKYGVPVTGDLMISAVGTIGKVYIVKESDCFYYKDASVICFSKKEKNIDSKYLKLCLESGFLQNQIYSQSTGTTVDTITINKAQEYLFPLPNIKEQKRIVSKIEDLFSYLDTISSNLE